MKGAKGSLLGLAGMLVVNRRTGIIREPMRVFCYQSRRFALQNRNYTRIDEVNNMRGEAWL